jgi:serine protease inhibitor
MFRLHFYFGFLFSLVLVWAGCGKSGNERPIGTPTEGMQRIASKNAEFGWKLFQTTTAGGNDQNVLISPLSVHLALAMAVNGASGNTRQEMLQALHSADYLITDAMNKDWQDLMDLLTRQSGHPSVTLRNAFFYDPARLRLENAFREKLAEFYTAHIAQDNFNQAEGARDRINSWVKESTKGKSTR